MSVCENARPAPLRCPTAADILAAALAILPKGRAWQSNEGGPVAPIDRAFDPASFSNTAFSTRYRRGSTLYRFWKAVAETFAFLNQRLCDLRLEFWCATHKETDDLWMAEYGLPDACDPFPDLCTKVAAIGGTRCEYYAEIAARMGWSIACIENVFSCGDRVGFSRAGRARAGATIGLAVLKIVVYLPESPAYTPTGRYLTTRAGRMRAGRRQSCGPDLLPLQCLLSRVVHAEIQTVYEVSNNVS